MNDAVRIGGGSGFWGETGVGVGQLLKADLDYLVFDHLAEITMSIMARARADDPERGYATDFVRQMKEHLPAISGRGVKVITNSGGVNPTACGRAIESAIEAHGLQLRVAVVTGDDLLGEVGALADAQEMFTGAPFPPSARLVSVNAYLGALPIVAALAQGADIVITGRIADSAATLAACIYEHGWSADDFDPLAGASVAGHILECTTQASGGNFTDWEEVASSLLDIGYPIVEVAADGSFVCTKPEATGGKVTRETVGEQLLYEIGDPRAYVLPDVVVDLSRIELREVGPDRILVHGAKGRPPTDTYKVSATFADGFRGGDVLFFYGFDADKKAKVFADVAVRRAARRLQALGLAPFTETLVEVVGDESHYGAARQVFGSREVAVKIAAKHPEAKGVAVLLQEGIGSALGAPPGLCGFAGGRPKPSPVVRLFSFLYPKSEVAIQIAVDRRKTAVNVPSGVPFDASTLMHIVEPPVPALTCEMHEVPLVKLAVGRSGDKGDKANIGILARRAEYLPYVWAALTEPAVAERFAHFSPSSVQRFLLPGSSSINFVLHDVLGGGGIASLRNDPQGKGYAQILLDHPILVPRSLDL